MSKPISRWLTSGELVLVEDLDRVLDRDDVALTGPVDVVDHRGERRGLAAPGWPRDEDQAALLVGEPPHGLGKVQLTEGPGMGSTSRKTIPIVERWR